MERFKTTNTYKLKTCSKTANWDWDWDWDLDWNYIIPILFLITLIFRQIFNNQFLY